MAERILLIQPRWMTAAMAAQQIAALRERRPKARLLLLGPAPLSGVQFLPLPTLNLRSVLPTTWHLRRYRFDRAIVLADPGRGDVGYGEAKLWAFAARARRRQCGRESLMIVREAKSKRKAALVLVIPRLIAICDGFLPRRAALPGELWRSAQTFVYLRHAEHQHGFAPGRVLLIGPIWDEDAARRCGWQPVPNEKESVPVRLILTQGTEEIATNPMESGTLLCCCEAENIAFPSTFDEVENRDSFFAPGQRDRWLRRRP